MGITGLLKHIGSGQRTSLATLAAKHYAKHERPLRIAIDISIWLFQIQAGQGGSNPALRTFYYRLLRLIALNIHPLFVFDGPNKPLFKRNKKVGGPGVRVASVPEFLAKQLLKQFGIPMHVAPGEAEAECAMLQRLGIVDAVMSDDVDTIMFGSSMTIRNWSAEGSTKSPTHVDVHYSDEIKASTALTPQCMILVALMSGGDYIPEGIPGCGPKQAVAAAKAGFGRELCTLDHKSETARAAWREKLQMELRTNASKFFTRRNTSIQIPDDFPSTEILGFYTHPCISTTERVNQLRQSLRWDQPIEFAALREFAAEAFDWRNIGGAKKFIKCLAPCLLMQTLRIAGEVDEATNEINVEKREQELLLAIHGKRNHFSTDEQTEMRVSFVPAKIVPIDLSIEPEDDDFVPAGGEDDALDAVAAELDPEQEEVPETPSKRKRKVRPFDPTEPEKAWVLREWVQLACPHMLEDHESPPVDMLGRGNVGKKATAKRSRATQKKAPDMPANALMRHVRVTRPVSSDVRSSQDKIDDCPTSSQQKRDAQPAKSSSYAQPKASTDQQAAQRPSFRLPSTQISQVIFDKYVPGAVREDNAARSFSSQTTAIPSQRTPKKTQRTAKVNTPQSRHSTITDFFSPTQRPTQQNIDVVNLLSSSPARPQGTPTPRQAAASRLLDKRDQQKHHVSIDAESQSKKQDVAEQIECESINLATSPSPIRKLNFARTADARHTSTLNNNPAHMPISGVKGQDDSTVIDLASSPAAPAKIINTVKSSAHLRQRRSPKRSSNIVINSTSTTISSQTEARPAAPGEALRSMSVNSKISQPKQIREVAKHITLRDSLDGAWQLHDGKEDSISTMAQTSAAIMTTSPKASKTAYWRHSEVELLDLTGD